MSFSCLVVLFFHISCVIVGACLYYWNVHTRRHHGHFFMKHLLYPYTTSDLIFSILFLPYDSTYVGAGTILCILIHFISCLLLTLMFICRFGATVGGYKSNSHPEGGHTTTPLDVLTLWYRADCCSFVINIYLEAVQVLAFTFLYQLVWLAFSLVCLFCLSVNICTLHSWLCSCTSTANVDCGSCCHHKLTYWSLCELLAVYSINNSVCASADHSTLLHQHTQIFSTRNN